MRGRHRRTCGAIRGRLCPGDGTGALAGRAGRQFRRSRHQQWSCLHRSVHDIRARGRAAAGDAGRGRAIRHADCAVHALRGRRDNQWQVERADPAHAAPTAIRRLHRSRDAARLSGEARRGHLVGRRRLAHPVAAAAEGGPPGGAARRAASCSAAPAAPAPRGTTPAETPGAATGAMEIDSRPTGAKVFVDDRAAGATPVRLPDVTPGSHTVRLELPEHHAWTETVQVTRGKTTRVAGSLEPIR